jgi:hypothetical protein
MRDGTGANPAEDNPAIPAGYTYFGQLVSHDLSHAVETAAAPAASGSPENARTPRLDLECIYGFGPASRPELYERPDDNPAGLQRYLLRVGSTDRAQFGRLPPGVEVGCPFDLPRLIESRPGPDGCPHATATDPIIADPRNDDNLIISQLHLLFSRVHNRAASLMLAEAGGRAEAFAMARAFLVACYQDIIRHDYLKRILRPDVYADFLSPQPRLLRLPPDSPYLLSGETLPAEFVFAAGRAGHAMVRNKYVVNDTLPLFPALHSLDTMLDFSGFEIGRPGNKGKFPLPADWVVDWKKFFGPGALRSRRIDPFIALTLASRRFGRSDEAEGGLIYFDLLRSYRDPGLPSGQDLARRVIAELGPDFDCPVLTGEAILPSAFPHTAQPNVAALEEVFARHPILTRQTPLFYYLLQEAAMCEGGERLGPLGSFITALTFHHVLSRATGPEPRVVADMDQFLGLRDLDDDAFRERVIDVAARGTPVNGPAHVPLRHNRGGSQDGQHRSQ